MEWVLAVMVANDEEDFLMGFTLDISMAVIQTCLGMLARYVMMLECMTFTWPLHARHDELGYNGINGQ